jgi:hypothetical protein
MSLQSNVQAGEATAWRRRSASELARSPSGRAGCAQRHINVAEHVQPVLAGDHCVERLADATVSWMSPEAKAPAQPVPHDLLSMLDDRPDLRTVDRCREGIEGRSHALDRISHGLTDSPACLGEGVSEVGVPVVAHSRIISPATT